MSTAPLTDVVRRLYESHPEDFVAARAAGGAAPPKAGHGARARRIAALRKPTVAAWLVNLLALRRPELVEELAELSRALRAAQRNLRGDQLRELSTRRRRAVSSLVAEARKLASAARPGLSAAKLPLADVESTLTAALADEEVAALVRTGRLVRTVTYDGFGEVPKPRLRLLVTDDETDLDDENPDDAETETDDADADTADADGADADGGVVDDDDAPVELRPRTGVGRAGAGTTLAGTTAGTARAGTARAGRAETPRERVTRERAERLRAEQERAQRQRRAAERRAVENEIAAAEQAVRDAEARADEASDAELLAVRAVADIEVELADLEHRRAAAQTDVSRLKLEHRSAQRDAAVARRRYGDARAALDDIDRHS